MIYLYLILILLPIISYVYIAILWRVRLAKSLGLPYFIIPFYPSPFPRIFLVPIATRLVRWLGLTSPWSFLITMDWQVQQQYDIYRLVGSDVFFSITPWDMILHVADADMAAEVLNGKMDNGELYSKIPIVAKMMGLFGPNVITAEGPLWKKHRKATIQVVNRSLEMVWDEAIVQARDMQKHWINRTEGIRTMHRDCSRVALGVIAYAGFSKQMCWLPAECEDDTPKDHSGRNSYQKCLRVMFGNFIWTVLAPSWILRYLPLKAARDAGKASDDFRFYSNKWFKEKKTKLETFHETAVFQPSRMDVIESLIKYAGLYKGTDIQTPLLTKEEVIGNAFIFILAGHETTGNTLANAIYFLAMHPQYQLKLHEHIDTVLKDIETTTYKQNYVPLAQGWITAIMFETMRLLPPTVILTRKMGDTSRCFPIGGKTINLPPGLDFWVEVIGLSHNPKYWVLPGQTEAEAAIDQFRPERWLVNNMENAKLNDEATGTINAQTEGMLANFFRPHKGSSLSFSYGKRTCIGQKFAQVEFAAVLFTLFHNYRVEFVLGEHTLQEVGGICRSEMKKYGTILTLQPTTELPKLRWIPRK